MPVARQAAVAWLFLLVPLLSGPWSPVASGQPPAEEQPLQVVVSPEARAIHQRGFVFDGHNDLPWEIRSKGSRSLEKIDIAQSQPRLHTDIQRLQAGGVGAQFWSVYVPSKTAQTGQAHQTTLEQIEIVYAMMDRYPEVFELARSHADILRIRQAGKIASLIGVEGGHSIEDSLDKLRRLYELGARYMTLTHSDSLDWADSCSDQQRCGGLSEFGCAVVREMNRLGMLVDLSHVAPATMQAALEVSQAPVIFSHSSARAVADHPRNVPDEILEQLPANGGIVMINFFSGFVVPGISPRRGDVELAVSGKSRPGRSAGHARERARYRPAIRFCRVRYSTWSTILNTSFAWPGSITSASVAITMA